MQRAARVDTNHTQIVTELRKAGYKVKSLAQLKNCCDLLVGKGEKLGLFEVKSIMKIKSLSQADRVKYMTNGERRFAEDFRVWVVVDSEEIIQILDERV